MRNFRLLLFFVLTAAALVLVDTLAWNASGLEQGGHYGALAEPVDDLVEDYVGPWQKKRILEKDLMAAMDDGPLYAKRAKSLVKHLETMKLHDETLPVMERVVMYHGDKSHKDILDAYGFVIKRYLKNDERKKLEETLLRLTRVVESPPNVKWMRNILSWARKAKLNDLFLRLAERYHTLPPLAPKDRLAFLLTLRSYYDETGAKEKAEALSALIKKYADKKRMADLMKQVVGRIRQRVKAKDAEGAFNLLEALHRDYPDVCKSQASIHYDVGLSLLNASRYDDVLRVWELIDRLHPVLGSQANAVHLRVLAVYTSDLLLYEQKKEQYVTFANILQKHAPSFPMLKYFQAQAWVASGAKEPAPRPVYLLRHLPTAKVAIDGKLDDPVWGQVAPLPGPYHYEYDGQETGIARKGTRTPTGKLFYTDDRLYVGGQFPEPAMDKIVAELDPGWNGRAWSDDCLEFFFFPRRCLKVSGYQYGVSVTNAACRVIFPVGRPSDKEKTPGGIQWDVQRTDTGYSFELSIPLSEWEHLPADPSGTIVTGNFRRQRYLKPEWVDEEQWKNSRFQLISWSPLIHPGKDETIHSVSTFNFFKFE